jgi:hypothetical protein
VLAGGNEQRDLRSGESSSYAEAWLRRRRFTPSPGTGPSQDHTGLYNGSGYYMYFEASSPNWPLVTSSLVRVMFDLIPRALAVFHFHLLLAFPTPIFCLN